MGKVSNYKMQPVLQVSFFLKAETEKQTEFGWATYAMLNWRANFLLNVETVIYHWNVFESEIYNMFRNWARICTFS